MGKYGFSAQNYATTTALRTVILLSAGTTLGRSAEIIEVIMTGGRGSGPQDIMHDAVGNFCTMATTGTAGSAPVAVPLDPLNGNASKTGAAGAQIAFTAEPSVYDTVNPLLYGFNQRGGMRFSVPQGEGMKIFSQATGKMAFGMQVISSVAGNVNANYMYWEP